MPEPASPPHAATGGLRFQAHRLLHVFTEVQAGEGATGLILLAAICSFFLTIIAALIKKWPWVLALHAGFILLILSPLLLVMASAFWDNVASARSQ